MAKKPKPNTTTEQLHHADQQAHTEFATHIPQLNVLGDSPLAATQAFQDRFNLAERLGPIYDILRHPKTSMPMAIAIYGGWGSGKTTAMHWLESLLNEWNKSKNRTSQKHHRVRTVWFDPWKYDNKEDVWRGLLSEVIIESTRVENASPQKVMKAIRNFGGFLGQSFVHVMAGMTLKGGVTGAEAELSLSGIKDILDEYKQTTRPEKAYLNEFENTLKDWITTTLGEDERMVIFIDDLDRCMPDVALQVLEALKLYLNIDRLIFVVGVDKPVIESLVQARYDELKVKNLSADKYLAKMFQVEQEIEPDEDMVRDFFLGQLDDVEYWQHMSEEHKDIFTHEIMDLAKRNPREVKRLINSAIMEGTARILARRVNREEPQT